jgi:hypothetical protein
VQGNGSESVLDAYVAAGATHLILEGDAPWDFDAMERLVRWRDKRNG